MKKSNLIFTISMVAMMGLAACNCSKKSTNSTTATDKTGGATQAINSNTEQKTMNDTTKANKDEVYRLIVSFISIGEGTDMKAVNELRSYIEESKKNYNKGINPVEVPWGREGEVDFIFRLSNLSDEEQIKFVNGLTSMYTENKLVQISERSRCPHIRN